MLMRQWDFHQTKAMQMTWMGSGTQHLTDAALLVGLGAQIITLEMSCLVRVKVNRVRMEREEAPNALRRVAPFLISRGRTEDCLGLLISRVKTEDCMGLRDARTCHSAEYVTLSRAHMCACCNVTRRPLSANSNCLHLTRMTTTSTQSLIINIFGTGSAAVYFCSSSRQANHSRVSLSDFQTHSKESAAPIYSGQ